MKWMFTICFCIIFLSSLLLDTFAQDALDDNLDEEPVTESTSISGSTEKAPNLVTETIKSISASQKIFIITNENQSIGNGDFISLLLQNQLVCRALVAKNTDTKLSGIKIVKIYSLDLWKQLDIGKDVQILRGDDSYFAPQKIAEKEVTKKKAAIDTSKVKSEDDLYNTTTLDEGDDGLEVNAKRQIKTDNLLAINIGMIDGVTDTGATTRYTHLNGTWAYQIVDNIWTEFTLGSNTIKDLPVLGVDTRMTSYSARLKYTISAPFYSYIQPYIGYQVIAVQSPGAQFPAELLLVDQLKKSRIVAGATILRRIVPGWFVRVDFGSDLINGGLLLEF
jgi:hypothetical protein